MNTVFFPERVIPAHIITRCYDCPDFKEYGAAYQDGDVCQHDDNEREGTVDGSTIPNWCPRLRGG